MAKIAAHSLRTPEIAIRDMTYMSPHPYTSDPGWVDVRFDCACAMPLPRHEWLLVLKDRVLHPSASDACACIEVKARQAGHSWPIYHLQSELFGKDEALEAEASGV